MAIAKEVVEEPELGIEKRKNEGREQNLRSNLCFEFVADDWDSKLIQIFQICRYQSSHGCRTTAEDKRRSRELGESGQTLHPPNSRDFG